MAIVLHVGMGKCGSSALQQFLSSNPVLNCNDRQQLHYGVLRKNGILFSGKDINYWRKVSKNDFLVSTNIKRLIEDEIESNPLSSTLARLSKKHHLILSQEGWGRESKQWQAFDPFSENNLKVNVLIYVRPPVDWLNSAWWQWGAWTDHKFEYWLNKNISNTHWCDIYEQWQQLPFVNKVTVKLLPKDIVEDFIETFNVINKNLNRSTDVINKSMPDTVLRIFQHVPSLRAQVHDPNIEFMLNKNLKLEGKPAWIISQKAIQKILVQTKQANVRLLDYLSESDKNTMINDPRWWRASAYPNQAAIADKTDTLDSNQLISLSAKLIAKLNELEQENKSTLIRRLWKRYKG